MFNIIFYKMTSEKNRLDKEMEEIDSSSECIIKDSTSITDPTIVWQSAVATAESQLFARANYCWIPMFRRFYFIEDVKILNANTIEIKCHVDVLSSFKESIRSNYAIILRTEDSSYYNLYLDDGTFNVYQDTQFEAIEFENGFSLTPSFVLAVAGTGASS